MSENPKSYEVILLDHAEPKHDVSGEYLSAFNLDGANYKINSKRQELWGVFTNSPKGTPILLTLESFHPDDRPKETITFVSNAQVANFDAFWKAGIQTTLKRLLTSADDDRIRSQALSYAKDIWVAKIADKAEKLKETEGSFQIVNENYGIKKTMELAKVFFYFIKGEQETEG